MLNAKRNIFSIYNCNIVSIKFHRVRFSDLEDYESREGVK
ncbi:uncharacterized protein METZ01_LOCUS425587, partial [marine metagenome]